MQALILFRVLIWLAGACGVASCTLAYVAFERAGLPYNAEGHYFDGLVNYHQQSVLGYALAALVALLLTLALAWIAQRARQH